MTRYLHFFWLKEFIFISLLTTNQLAMKKMFVILIYLSSFSVFAQDYHPMLVEGNEWQVMTQGIDGGTEIWEVFNIFSLGQNDTTINNQLYRQIKEDDQIVGFGYEEDKKVFYRPIDWQQDEDILLYDFNLVVGDTFDLYWVNYMQDSDTVFLFHKLKVLTIDSVVLTDNSIRKRLTFEVTNFHGWTICLNSMYFHWIEGIGNTDGLIYKDFECFEWWNQLRCFKYNDEILYGPCLNVSTADINQKQIKLYPNPFQDIVKIDDPNDELLSSVIYDVQGKVIQKKANQTELNLSDLSSGLYILKVKFKDQSVGVYKLIK